MSDSTEYQFNRKKQKTEERLRYWGAPQMEVSKSRHTEPFVHLTTTPPVTAIPMRLNSHVQDLTHGSVRGDG